MKEELWKKMTSNGRSCRAQTVAVIVLVFLSVNYGKKIITGNVISSI